MELVVVLEGDGLIIYFIYIGEIRASWLFLKFDLKLTSSLKRWEWEAAGRARAWLERMIGSDYAKFITNSFNLI